MLFQSIRYMEWTKTLEGCRIDLRPSSIERVFLSSLDIDLTGLEISGKNSYGYPPLVDAIASHYKVSPENIITTLGTSQALFLVCAALLSPGDRVLVENPTYEPLWAVPAALGADINRFERRFQNGYRVDTDCISKELEKGIRIMLLSNLHNPSGVGLSGQELRMMAQAARASDAYMLVDEVYLDLFNDSIRQSAFALEKNVIVISSLTKAYGLGGLRCGWMLAPAPIIATVKRIIDYMHVEGVFLSEQVALHCFDRLSGILEAALPQVSQNFSRLRTFVQKETRLSWVEPDGGVIAFPRIEPDLDAEKLAEHLREQYGVCVVPGHFFGCRDHFRIGFGGDPQAFQEGLKCLGRALDDLSS